MASKTANCGICNLRRIIKPSVVVCLECDKGLCLECKEHHGVSKETRNHNPVPISKYEQLPSNVLEISQFCKEHAEKFQLYCKKHDSPCCSRCVVVDHLNCQDLIQLDDMSGNVKKSYGVHLVEQAMTDMLENIKRIQNDRQANLSTLKIERKMIKREIKQLRIKINSQLDKLQETMMKELYEAESKESKMIGQLLDSIQKNEKEIKQYQENLMYMKQHASDIQTFLAMKEIERNVAEKDEYFSSLVKSNKLNQIHLSSKMNDALQNSFKEIRKLGEIIVSSHSSKVAIIRKTETQAQIVVADVRSMSIENLSFVLQSTIDTKLDLVTGCTLLPDGRMVFSSYKSDCVSGFNCTRSNEFNIILKLTNAFDVAYIQENNSIAVSRQNTKCISIIDVESRTVKETIPVDSDTEGIVSRNKTLIYCAGDRGLWIINLTDKSVRNIVRRKMSEFAYVTTFGDKLYYTDWKTHTVTCCDFHGTIQWEFKDERVLMDPQGISVDNAGNVYVVGYRSDNVVVISANGQRHRQLLSSYKNGIFSPLALHYDRSTNQLLVTNWRGEAFLYMQE